MSDGEQIYTDVRFWAQIIGDSKRTVICEPEKVDAVREAVESRGLGGIVTVQGSLACPPSKLLIIDEPALLAASEQMSQRIRFPWT